MNTKGQVVNLRVRFNHIKVPFADQSNIPRKRAIRLLMNEMGFRYQDVGNTMDFVETEDIKAKEWHYPQERRSDKYKGTVFVSLSEPYCSQNHRGWIIDGDISGYQSHLVLQV
ncbi:hypothetical protein BC939DRAFT_493894 [Gamsiella multidivaricata]|uniref:uncharacterized protein n=1 Tax=Gamsiella multidivaricata TaxID=101098 RepID=UPI0022210ABE|nr:uncharacterized protein BC939DRAFT_493894 [Gamsiella multidivaricata]KAI7821944.1 hypothetical protein BC939DRAFT_493894 [Gamsiella multidivaricata]